MVRSAPRNHVLETESAACDADMPQPVATTGGKRETPGTLAPAFAVNWWVCESSRKNDQLRSHPFFEVEFSASLPLGRSLCMGCCTSKSTARRSRTPSPAQLLTNPLVRVRPSGESRARARIDTTIDFSARKHPPERKRRACFVDLRRKSRKRNGRHWQVLSG